MKTKKQAKDRESLKAYPYLGVWHNGGSGDFLVMFTSKGEGVVVNSSSIGWCVGETFDDLDESEFTYYLGELVMSNE